MTGGKGLSTTTITIIVVLILLLLGGLYFVYYYLPSIKASYKANNNPSHTAEEDAAGHSAELMLFYVDWCPHCKTAKPVWEDIKTEYENKTINGYHVMFTEINCTNENAEIEQLMNKYSIEGFPTIKLLKDGQIIEFDAKPTKANLEQFLNSVL
jgi:thiol-disulfide isomerase/thioredoxin